MSHESILARHRAATPTRSIALRGLSAAAKSNAAAMGRPALIIAAASGLVFGVGAPAHAGAQAPDNTAATVQAPAAAPAPAAVPAAAAPAAAGTVHTVVSGDTLGAISARYGVSLNAVFSANGMSMSTIIYPGNQIQIPGAGSGGAAAAPAPAPTLALASTSITPVAPAPAPAPAPAVAASGAGAALVGSAYAQLGATQDCTILVEQALRSIGKSVGDLAPTQFFQYGTVVGTPAPGDLVITSGHVGIYVGDGQVISSGMNYVNETIVHPLSWLSGYSFVRVA